ncbi:protein I'm not dead yet-like isoform X2 [Pararge aegeria]|uniref:protein I'm not dead yet-like isoform X2 n=1 Tax=Pararge aegeria TaxID=116150 RepID=UPI0019D258F0|nr:protein I'm not dead yet-like isoform X2 [Pararge aegeria]
MENTPDEISVPVTVSGVKAEVDGSVKSSDDDQKFSIKEMLRLFLHTHWRGILCFVVPLILIPIQLSFPPQKYQWCAYTLALMAVFWVGECIPLAVTSFLPIVVFPLTGIMSTTETCACYMNDTIMMFLGSMWLAYAVEQSGLHMRLALCAIRSVGYSHYKLLFAMSFVTMFISMWITNTAATTMMVPINFALLKVFEDQNLIKIYDTGMQGENVASDITTCYFCAASFSATIGGIGTLVGTATNFVFKGLFSKIYPDAPEYLSFPKFSAFAIPYMLIMEICVYLYLIVVYFGFLRPNSIAARNAKMPSEGIEAAKKAVEEKLKALGRITFWEILVILLFSFAILLFFSRSPQIFTGWGDIIPEYYNIKDKKFVKDSAAATMAVFLMLLLPFSLTFFDNCRAKNYGKLPEKNIQSVLNWKKMNDDMPYSFMFLLGGGFALSEAAKKEYTDLNGKIGTILKHFKNLPNKFIILFVVVFTIFTTNFASNVAVCNVIAPIVMQLAKEINKNPLWYNIAAGFSSSYAFCLPVGTPGNLVVQSAANIPTSKMIKAGIGPTVNTIIITWFCICFWAPVIWPDLKSLPNWIE